MQKFTETTHRSVVWLKRESDEGRLETSPPFQRNPVWSNKQKGALIETMLLEYPIPEIYMQDIVSDVGRERHVVVDGQQRLRAVLEYVSGEFAIDEDSSKWNGLSFDELSADDKKRIYEYSFVTRLLPELPEDQIRGIFQRINRNTVTLNQQELRHATYWGAFIKLMEELADLEFWSAADIFSPNDRRRMLDAEYVSELAVAYLNGLQNKKTKLEDFYRLYEQEFDQSARLRNVFFKVLGEIEQLPLDLRALRYKKRSDFYTLFLGLAVYVDVLPFSNEVRIAVGRRLVAFAAEVDSYVAREVALVSKEAVAYGHNVERAASDLGSRRERQAAMASVLQSAIDGTIPSETELPL